jgi:hypothetical protein
MREVDRTEVIPCSGMLRGAGVGARAGTEAASDRYLHRRCRAGGQVVHQREGFLQAGDALQHLLAGIVPEREERVGRAGGAEGVAIGALGNQMARGFAHDKQLVHADTPAIANLIALGAAAGFIQGEGALLAVAPSGRVYRQGTGFHLHRLADSGCRGVAPGAVPARPSRRS